MVMTEQEQAKWLEKVKAEPMPTGPGLVVSAEKLMDWLNEAYDQGYEDGQEEGENCDGDNEPLRDESRD
jgi:hypothetical protein